MVSVNVNASNMRYSPSFGNNAQNPANVSYLDDFVSTLQESKDKNKKGKFFTRNNTTTGAIPLFIGYAYSAYAIFSAIASRHLPKPEMTKQLFKYAKNIVIANVAGLLASLGINKIINTKTDENYKKVRETFDRINTNTDAKLADEPVNTKYASAQYVPASGIIQVSKSTMNDPLTKRTVEKLLKHELVHAQQYELVARSKDGIKKINYAVMKSIVNDIQKQKDAKEYADILYSELNNSSQSDNISDFAIKNTVFNKFKNTNQNKDNRKVPIMGGIYDVNLSDYVNALHIMLNNPDATLDDIPIIIDKEHYQNVIDKKGALSPEEEEKADAYYQAMLNYTPMKTFGAALNPWSDYRKNLLEREAYKENPSFITRLTEKFAK